jgi:diguanylate cyclase (GGDEF)-like protein
MGIPPYVKGPVDDNRYETRVSSARRWRKETAVKTPNEDSSPAPATERRAQKGLVQPKTLGQILEADGAVSLWLSAQKGRRTDVVITFVDELSATDKEALIGRAHLFLGIHDDLFDKVTQLQKENNHLRSLTLTDALTGLYNTRFFTMQLDIEIARTRRTGQPSSMMMIDLDNFKILNDTMGHVQGNRFLMKAATTLREQLRPTDIVCRYGGDEFAVIMPSTDLFDAARIANRLQQSLASIPLRKLLPVSASIGVAEYLAASRGGSDELVHQADMALYKAKKNGKNQVFYAGKPEKSVELDSVTQEEKWTLAHGHQDVEQLGTASPSLKETEISEEMGRARGAVHE